MIKTVSAKRGKKGIRVWILPGLLGVFLLHPLSAGLSNIEPATALPEPAPAPAPTPAPSRDLLSQIPSSSDHPQAAARHREERILKFLSRFVTGLTDEEEAKLAAFIGKESRRYGFDPELIMALISTESSFYNRAVSSKGALGLMQLIPATGKEVAEINDIVWHGDQRTLFDPFLNIRLGIHYLYTLYLRFGDLHLALTAYNHGPGKVSRWLRDGEKIPTKYSNKVLTAYEELTGFHGREAKKPSGIKNENPSSLPPSVQMVSRS